MRKILFIILGIAVIFSSDLAKISLKGSVINDDYKPLIQKYLKTGELHLSGNGIGIIWNYESPYIGIDGYSVLSRYSLQGYGIIPYWTDMDEFIDKWVDSVKQNERLNIEN